MALMAGIDVIHQGSNGAALARPRKIGMYIVCPDGQAINRLDANIDSHTKIKLGSNWRLRFLKSDDLNLIRALSSTIIVSKSNAGFTAKEKHLFKQKFLNGVQIPSAYYLKKVKRPKQNSLTAKYPWMYEGNLSFVYNNSEGDRITIISKLSSRNDHKLLDNSKKAHRIAIKPGPSIIRCKKNAITASIVEEIQFPSLQDSYGRNTDHNFTLIKTTMVFNTDVQTKRESLRPNI